MWGWCEVRMSGTRIERIGVTEQLWGALLWWLSVEPFACMGYKYFVCCCAAGLAENGWGEWRPHHLPTHSWSVQYWCRKESLRYVTRTQDIGLRNFLCTCTAKCVFSSSFLSLSNQPPATTYMVCRSTHCLLCMWVQLVYCGPLQLACLLYVHFNYFKGCTVHVCLSV